MASFGYYGGEIGNLLNELANAGFFSYVLPFLLIFAVTFGILERVKVFEKSKSINGIIAFAVGLMALQFDFVSVFFAEIFPRLGIGLVIILAVIILVGLFAPTNKNWMSYIFLGIGGLVLVVILVNSAGAVGWSSGYWWAENWQKLAGVVVFLIIIGVIVGASSPSDPAETPFMKLLKGSTD